MCNDFLRQCYWTSPGTNFEAGLSLRARAPEFVSGRQESIICGPRHSQTLPEALRSSREFKILKFSMNL